MTRTELTDLLHQHVRDGEPTTPMRVDAVMARGRRTVRRRRHRVAMSTEATGIPAAAVGDKFKMGCNGDTTNNLLAICQSVCPDQLVYGRSQQLAM